MISLINLLVAVCPLKISIFLYHTLPWHQSQYILEQVGLIDLSSFPRFVAYFGLWGCKFCGKTHFSYNLNSYIFCFLLFYFVHHNCFVVNIVLMTKRRRTNRVSSHNIYCTSYLLTLKFLFLFVYFSLKVCLFTFMFRVCIWLIVTFISYIVHHVLIDTYLGYFCLHSILWFAYHFSFAHFSDAYMYSLSYFCHFISFTHYFFYIISHYICLVGLVMPP